MSDDVLWCTTCGARFTEEEIAGYNSCPECEDEGVPCPTEKDFTVDINWHELRVLCIWAENWARAVKDEQNESRPLRTVHAIARRLQTQAKDNDLAPLTLSQEILELQTLPEVKEQVEVMDGAGEKRDMSVPAVPINGPGAVGHGRRPSETEN